MPPVGSDPLGRGVNLSEQLRSRNRYFDLLKGIACIAVVFIHCQFPDDLGMVVGALAKFAVPIFFMISGYYAVRNGQYKCKKKILHILKLVVLAELLYFFYEALKSFFMEGIGNFIEETFNLNTLIQGVLLNRPLTSSHLWFLYALIYCYFTLWLIVRFKWQKAVPAIIVIGQIGFVLLGEGLTLFGMSYAFPFDLFGYEFELIFYNCYLFRALPFFLFGYWCANAERKVKLPNALFYLLLIGGSALAIVERYMAGWFQFYVGTLIIVAILFVRAEERGSATLQPNKLVDGLVRIGEKDSDFVYVIHLLIASMLNTFMKLSGLASIDNGFMRAFDYIKPLFILAICLTAARMRNWFFEKLKSRRMHEK